MPARLGVIPAMGAARASPLEWGCMESLGCVWSDKGQECPCVPVLSVPTCSCGAGPLQAGAAAWSRDRWTTSVFCNPNLQQRLAFTEKPKDTPVFWAISPQQVLLPVAAELWRCLWGRRGASKREGKAPGRGTTAPSRDKGLGLAFPSQLSLGSSQLFHVCLQITTVSFFIFFPMQSSKSTELFWCRSASWWGLVCDSRRAHGCALLQLLQGWDGGGGEGKIPGIIRNKGFSCLQPCGVTHSQPQRALQEVLVYTARCCSACPYLATC